MSNVKKGQLAVPKEWAKHLRKWGKRAFWKCNRRAEKTLIKTETKDN